MFKLFERDKCQNVALDPNDVAVTTIVPGTILIMTSSGAQKATAGDDLTLANAGLFYISNDYYNNTLKASYGNTTTPVTAQTNVPSPYIAAIPITERFECVIPLAVATTALTTLLEIKDGAIAAATTGNVAFALALETNGWTTGPAIDTKITTFIVQHEKAGE